MGYMSGEFPVHSRKTSRHFYLAQIIKLKNGIMYMLAVIGQSIGITNLYAEKVTDYFIRGCDAV